MIQIDNKTAKALNSGEIEVKQASEIHFEYNAPNPKGYKGILIGHDHFCKILPNGERHSIWIKCITPILTKIKFMKGWGDSDNSLKGKTVYPNQI